MVVDTSAILAVLQVEPEAEDYAIAIEGETVRLVSAVSILEAGILAESRKGVEGSNELDAFLREARLEVVAFNGEQAEIARRAYARFGKGRHRSGLNMGDCAVYALSKTAGEPLLFKGSDFSLTDVEAFNRP